MAFGIDDAALAMTAGAAESSMNLLGSWIGDYFNRKAASKSRKASYEMMLANQAWLERMSNTAHQREVADLRAAGLNPILSATGGSGASTPSYSASAPDLSALSKSGEGFSRIGNGVLDKAYKFAQFKSDMRLMDANASTAEKSVQEKEASIANIKANTAQVETDTAMKQLELERTMWQKMNAPNSWKVFGKDGSLSSALPALSKGTESLVGDVAEAVKKGYNAVKNFGVNNASSSSDNSTVVSPSSASSTEVSGVDKEKALKVIQARRVKKLKEREEWSKKMERLRSNRRRR